MTKNASPRKTTRAKKPAPKKAVKKTRRWLPSWRLLFRLALCGLVVLGAWLIYLDAVITSTFDGKKWAIPAKVYAQPVELYEGMTLDPDTLQGQLRRQGYQPVRSISRPGTFSRAGDSFEIYVRGFRFPDGPRDSMALRADFSGNSLRNLQTTSGRDVPVIRLDPQMMGGIYPASHEDRMLVQLKDVPATMVKALVAVEDRDFYEHWGLSPKGIARAMVANIQAGGIVQGGSTLTQQLIKNFYLNNKRTFTRKIEEAFMSLLLEWHYSKDEILETYLNEVYLGQQGQRSVHGFALASEFYFARPLSELNLAKQALMVAIVKGPSYYNPRRYPERAKERRDLVLDMMADQGIITAAEAEQAQKQSLGVVSRERLQANAFPAYIDLVKRQLRQDYRNEDLTSEGLRIFTNMNPIVQQQAQDSLSKRIKQLDGGKDTGLEGAMVVTSSRTGEVQAIVGGRDAGFAGFNRALDARRPIGSLVKPAVFLTALADPSRYTLATRIKDEPITLKENNGREWSPENYSRKVHGEVPLYLALAKSYNLATIRLGMDVGVPAVVSTLKNMGLTRDVNPFPSLLLGSIDMTPVEVAAMYQTLASGGFRVPLRAIDAVLDAHGQPLTQYSLSVEEAFPPEQVDLINYALQRVMWEGTGKSAYKKIPSSVRVAGKTGTTDELRDSWFAGYSGDTLAVTWLGRDDNKSARYTGGTGALRIWSDFMAQRPLKSLSPPVSSKVAFFNIDRATGHMGGAGCQNDVALPFIKGSEPLQKAPCAKASPAKGVVDWFKALWE
ncbi:penicillin-binding protein 1B [Parendozoicomonas haliclonae]|uniref:Penicillin-binding protein 1B n=1 Tax=Parendozoicomonas haliclonae TaxID=1960125 RepID=A0A1X7AIW1_9GAMM|nr:penicillin-binding protein 1B [Parendozoicomonas haliclonae]SMA44831.1 Penicillin-binding protein 1B [Parendozoicomonas haliclonae]